MKGKAQALAALGVFLGMAAYVLVEERDTSDPGSVAALTHITPDQVKAVEWKAADGVVRLVRAGSQWTAASPVAAPADPAAVASVLDDLLTHSPGRVLDTPRSSLAGFGLQPPQFQVSYDLTGGRRISLLFGAENPGGMFRYARSSDSSQVFLVAAAPVTTLQTHNADSAVDHRLAELDTDKLERVSYHSPSGAVEVQRRGQDWEMTRPWAARVAPDTITGANGIAVRINAASILRFERNPRSLPHYGLEPARATVQLVLQGGQRLGVMLGSDTVDGTYATRLSGGAVFVLRQVDARAMVPEPVALVDRRLVPLQANDVRAIELQGPTTHVKAHQTRGRWQSDAGGPLPAAIEQLVASCTSLYASGIVPARRQDWNHYGLDHPSVTLTITETNGQSLRILFGRDPRSTGALVAARAGEEIVFTLPASLSQLLSHFK